MECSFALDSAGGLSTSRHTQCAYTLGRIVLKILIRPKLIMIDKHFQGLLFLKQTGWIWMAKKKKKKKRNNR